MAGHFAPDARFAEGHGAGALPMPAVYFRLVLRRFGQRPEQVRALLAGTGIDAERALALEPEERIRLWQLLRMLQNLSAVAPPDWALDVGPVLQGPAHGALGEATATAADLGEALAVLERFAHVRSPYFRLTSERNERRHTLEIAMQLPLEPALSRSLLESLLLSIQALVTGALGGPMHDARFRLAGPAPPYAERYPNVFDAAPSFEAPVSSVSVPAAWLRLPCPFADTARHRTALEALEAAERALQGTEFIVAQVERIFAGCPTAPASAEEVAKRLHLSRRTLVRRLADCGTSFRALADAHRRSRAEQLLADETLSIAEVGDRLGYADAANFGRAFRRWFGRSPSEMRAGGARPPR